MPWDPISVDAPSSVARDAAALRDSRAEAPLVDLAALYRDSGIGEVLAELDRDLVGLAR